MVQVVGLGVFQSVSCHALVCKKRLQACDM